jgi:cytochrome c oxidase subunit 2
MKLHRWIVLLVITIIAATAPVGKSAEPRRIEITVSRFSYSPSEITLKKGEPVVIVLKSLDVTHGLAVNELGIRKNVASGQTTEIAFTPMRTGIFKGKCSYLCGTGHLSMVLTLNVVN